MINRASSDPSDPSYGLVGLQNQLDNAASTLFSISLPLFLWGSWRNK